MFSTFKMAEEIMKKVSYILLALLACNLCGCYRMPTEDDYSTVPLVNNPDLTREKPSQQLMPGVGY